MEFLKNKIEKHMQEEITIPHNEMEITFSSSSGPGGQNVNKRATKAMLCWNVMESNVLTEEQKQKIISTYSNQINKDSQFILYSQITRSQEQNKQDVISKLNRIINQALKPTKKRILTNPTRTSNEKRIRKKKEQSEKKKLRKKVMY